MASNFHIQRPYVLTTLSSPLERPDGPGRFSVGEVFGQQAGSKKRKRSELSVGIDGDAASLYDVSSSTLITSYPIPPQSFFTCSPYSLRWKAPESKDVTRYTYISTEDTLSFKKQIILFKDVLGASGDTTSTTVSRVHTFKSPIIHLSTAATSSISELGDKTPKSNIMAVSKEGDIGCFHAETLEERWIAGPSVLLRGLPSSGKGCQVDFVQAAQAVDIADGIFGGKNDVFAVLPQKVQRDGFNPDVLLVVISVYEPQSQTSQRYLQMLALSAESRSQHLAHQGILPVFSSPIPARVINSTVSPEYRLDVRSGSLQELDDGVLYSYNLAGGSVRLESKLQIPDMNSSLRLSKSSVLTATSSSLDIYSPVYRSLQASTAIDTAEEADQSLPYRKSDRCTLITYFGSRDIAVGVRGSALIAVQVEPPKARATKRRAEGLLIDSIGRGVSLEQNNAQRNSEGHSSSIFANHLPGSVSDAYWAEWREQVAKANTLLSTKGIGAFEQLLAEKFGVKLAESKVPNKENTASSSNALPEWLWPSDRAEYPRVDRRWVLYAISKVFAWQEKSDSESDAPRLSCQVVEGSVVSYLADAGHLTVSNLISAFREDTRDMDQAEFILAEELPEVLSAIDPTMELLVSYLSATKLGAPELVASIRLVIRSLDLVQGPAKIMALGANEENQGDENDLIGMELDKAEEELKMTEFYVNNASTRARGLSVAFSKLGACAAPATVKTIRRLLKPEETLSLINILRMELVKDGWTTRYLDASLPETEDGEAPPDGSIKLIADLLCRCIDAIGSSGFLANGSLFAAMTSHADTGDFFKQFKAEVSVALEGIEEAVRLRGILTEVVKYGATVQKTLGQQKSKATVASRPKPPTLEAFPAEGRMLPLGLKSSTPRISQDKIVSGGEIIQRSKRETAMLIRKNLGPYVIERVGPRC